ncbi:AAA family ATPase [Agrococcus beijingensis]|uniref:AAA family ATPase n=1 Tax=Agrococcus beijingensis TaxID=3068634 RepID=UPI002741FF5D|nr:AAA family ATPase [Agrococcus sp. REN33]
MTTTVYDPTALYGDETAGNYEVEVAQELYRMNVRADARKRHQEANREAVALPQPRTLTAFLSEPDSDPEWIIDGLLATGGNVVLAAPYKAGKSTMRDNLVAALADGSMFLGQHQARQRRVTIIDNELDERTMRRWMRQHSITNADSVTVVPLRGAVSSFDLLDPTTRTQWADALRGCDVLIFDCLRPVLDALGLDEHKDAGRFLVAFDALKLEAGISEGVVIHHMGHNGERARGDSRILDWPDATWKIVRENSDDPASPRYFSAFGRDVDVPETRLNWDEAARQLTLGLGNRQEAKSSALVPDVLAFLADQSAPVSKRTIEDALTEQGHYRDPIRAAIKSAVQSGQVSTVEGPRRAILHSLSETTDRVRGSAREFAARTEIECASAPIGRARTHSPSGEGISARPAHSLTDPGYCPNCGMTGKHTRSCKAVTA